MFRLWKVRKREYPSVWHSVTRFRRGYSSPSNPIVLVIEAALFFISMTNSCQFLGLVCLNLSTLWTDLYIFVIYARAAGLFATTVTVSLCVPRSSTLENVFEKSIVTSVSNSADCYSEWGPCQPWYLRVVSRADLEVWLFCTNTSKWLKLRAFFTLTNAHGICDPQFQPLYV